METWRAISYGKNGGKVGEEDGERASSRTDIHISPREIYFRAHLKH